MSITLKSSQGVSLSTLLVMAAVNASGAWAQSCGSEAMRLYERANSEQSIGNVAAAQRLYAEAAEACDSGKFWLSLGDSLASVGDASNVAAALDAFGKAFDAARRDDDRAVGARAALGITQLGLSEGDPIKANKWLLVARQLDPDNGELETLQAQVDAAQEDLSSDEIQVAFSKTRGIGMMSELLDEDTSAGEYWGVESGGDDDASGDAEAEQADSAGAVAGADDEVAAARVAETTTIALPINFETNSVELTEQTGRNIVNLAEVLAGQSTASRIQLTGHADTRGDEAYNLALSQRRSEHVKNLLIELQPSLEGRITAIGKGEMFPIDSGNSARAHANNRRLEVTVSQ